MPWMLPVAIAGSAIVGGIMQNRAANKASDAQKYAADQQAQVTWDMYNQSRMDMDPFRQIGTNEAARAFGYTPSYGGDRSLDPSRYSYNGSAGTPQPQSISFDWESGLSRQGLGGWSSFDKARSITNPSLQMPQMQQSIQLPGYSQFGRQTPNSGNDAGVQPLPGDSPFGKQTPMFTPGQKLQPPPATFNEGLGGLYNTAGSQLAAGDSAQQGQAVDPYAGMYTPPGWDQNNGEGSYGRYGTPGSTVPSGHSVPSVQPSQQQYAGPGGQTSTVRTVPTYRKTGEGIDPTGGAKTYLDSLMSLDPFISSDATGNAGKWAGELANMNPNISADPTGGADKYKQQLEALEFKLDPTNEIYKWREAQTNKAIEQAAAARGMYNSRPTINALSDANMALQENEIGRQYEQNYKSKYQQLSDLFNMSMNIGGTTYGKAVDDYNRQYGQNADQFEMAKNLGAIKYGQATDNFNRAYGQNADAYNMAFRLGQANYGKALDAVKMGQGAAASMGQNALYTGNQMSNIYGNTGNAIAANALYKGQNAANTINGITNSALAGYGLYNMYK